MAMKTPQIVFLAAALVLVLVFFAVAGAAASSPVGVLDDEEAASGDDNYLATPAGVPRQRSRFLESVWKPPRRPVRCNRNPYVCRYPGSTGPDCCAGQCVDRGSDVYNCGRCGHMCKFTQSCCGGKCVDLNFDKRHCGSCFNKCHKGVLCIYGMCNYA